MFNKIVDLTLFGTSVWLAILTTIFIGGLITESLGKNNVKQAVLWAACSVITSATLYLTKDKNGSRSKKM